MPLKFKTEEARMQHPQASLIPTSMWNSYNLFKESLHEALLELMVASDVELDTVLSNSLAKVRANRLTSLAWLAIALSHPELEFSRLQEIAKQLNLDNTRLFHLLTTLGNSDYLIHFMEEQQDQIQAMIAADDFYAYWSAAQNGHLPVLEHLESQAPDQIQAMIAAYDFYAYQYAAKNGHLPVLEHL
ncbi:MAG: hypothetical protein B7X00_00230, partial [Legionella sp. 21-45-4]